MIPIMFAVLCDQETCWKPYLSDSYQIQTDSNPGDDDADDVIYNSDDETWAAICDCLHQYLQHSIDVRTPFCSQSLINLIYYCDYVNFILPWRQQHKHLSLIHI